MTKNEENESFIGLANLGTEGGIKAFIEMLKERKELYIETNYINDNANFVFLYALKKEETNV